MSSVQCMVATLLTGISFTNACPLVVPTRLTRANQLGAACSFKLHWSTSRPSARLHSVLSLHGGRGGGGGGGGGGMQITL